MSMTITHDGRVVEYDEMEVDPNLRWIGDPRMITDLISVLSGDSVYIGEPRVNIAFRDDNPVYNLTAAAMALGYDTVAPEDGTDAAREIEELVFPTVFDDMIAEGVDTTYVIYDRDDLDSVPDVEPNIDPDVDTDHIF